MNAAAIPTSSVNQIGMACLPGANSLPSKPRIKPMMSAPMMLSMVTFVAQRRWGAVLGLELGILAGQWLTPGTQEVEEQQAQRQIAGVRLVIDLMVLERGPRRVTCQAPRVFSTPAAP